MKVSNLEILQKHADLCATMAHPKRLAILEVLEGGETSVGDIAATVGCSVSTASQHLRIMRDKGVVVARKDGHTVCYRLRNPKIVTCCAMVREVLLEDLAEQGRMAAKLDRGRKK